VGSKRIDTAKEPAHATAAVGLPSASLLTVGIGDIHGRFHRVVEWLDALEQALGRPVNVAFAVGDVEAFADPQDHRRKAAKRTMPAEFFEYANKARRLGHRLYFIGGNNEDFSALHGLGEGGVLTENFEYLGRAGARELFGLKVIYLSGIFAPKWLEAPLHEPRTKETFKAAGYIRRGELERLSHLGPGADLMLTHEWPKGLVPRRGEGDRPLRAQRFPWIGNVHSRQAAEAIRPKWLFCGHSHVPLATSLRWPGGETHVACLDQAAAPEGSIIWVEWEGHKPIRAGWGITGQPSWTEGERWDVSLTPP
jgi:hypothetical protein